MAEPHEADKNFYIYAPETLAENAFVASAAGIVRLAGIIEDFHPDVLIIDPWRLFVGGDGNKEDVVMAGLKTLSQLRRDHPKLATILIHHLRKQQDGFRVSLRTDPHSWVESASGHYSLIGHSDATYGLEREISDSEELIVFGGVARATVAPTLLLDEDEDTLLFEPSRSEAVAQKLFTPVERGIWEVATRLGKFTYSDLLTAAKTTNRKAISAMLNKARSGGMITQDDGKTYRVTGIGGTNGTMMYLQ